MSSAILPEHAPAGSPEELARFDELQRRLPLLYRRAFADRHAEQTLVAVPSLTLDPRELAKLTGAPHYEERLLCLLMLLRQPGMRLVYVTSAPIAPAIIDYYLHLLPGVPPGHARRRLTLLSCGDAGGGCGCDAPASLTERVLASPAMLDRIRAEIPDAWSAHLTCFTATPLERTLAVRLGIPLYACDPALGHLGTKSGSREVFRRAGVSLPHGFEHLRDADDVAEALTALRRRAPTLRRAVVKLDEGFSGEGNATFAYDGAPDGPALAAWVRRELPTRLRFEAEGERWERYAPQLALMGGVVESFLEGDAARSPSVQCRIDPLGAPTIISTHDQLLGGPTGQVYWGCTFPARGPYVPAIHAAARRVADVLADAGVLGRFGVDFVSVRTRGRWETAAIEINIRKGGTTHPFLMLQFLTDGRYDPETASYRTAAGHRCCYRASDNLGSADLRGLTPDDLIDLAVHDELHFDAATQQGVMFHLIGALPAFGKLGAVAIGRTHAGAAQLFRRTVEVLERTGRQRAPRTRASAFPLTR